VWGDSETKTLPGGLFGGGNTSGEKGKEGMGGAGKKKLKKEANWGLGEVKERKGASGRKGRGKNSKNGRRFGQRSEKPQAWNWEKEIQSDDPKRKHRFKPRGWRKNQGRVPLDLESRGETPGRRVEEGSRK